MNDLSLVATTELVLAKSKDSKAAYWSYLNSILAGRGHPSSERVETNGLVHGTVAATDRSYVVTASGAWRKAPCTKERTHKQSQIYVPHWPSKNKYAPRRA